MTKIRSYVDSALGTAWAPWRGSLDKPKWMVVTRFHLMLSTECISKPVDGQRKSTFTLSGMSVAALEKLVSCVRLGKLRFLSFFL